MGEPILQETRPMVRRSDGFIVPWDRNAIVKQLLTETRLAKEFYEVRPISMDEAERIAIDVERKIFDLRLKFISGPLIRELVNNILLDGSRERPEYAIYRNILTRVGAPVYDAYLMDLGLGFKANENANLQPNAETAHKRKADWVSGEEYLLLMPPKLADAHLAGDLHIHDLEYFGTRPFCIDSSVTVPLVIDGWLAIRSIKDVIDPLFEQYASLATQTADYEVLDVMSLNIYALGRCRLVKVSKVMRRPARERALEIVTHRGRKITLTKDHRVPIESGLVRTGDLVIGHKLTTGPVAKVIGSKMELCILDELLARCFESDLETVYVRDIRRILDFLMQTYGLTLRELFRTVGMDYERHRHYYTQSTMPILLFKRVTDRWKVPKDLLATLNLGVTGSKSLLPVIYVITPTFLRLVGYFIAEGNYDVRVSETYNLAVTNRKPELEQDIEICIRSSFDTYLTKNRKRRGQMLFGGKLIYLLFRYVLGIEGGAKRKEIPELIFNIPEHLATEFWSAYVSGNGTCTYRPLKSDLTLSASTVSYDIASKTMLNLQLLGIDATLSLHEQAGNEFSTEGHTWTSKSDRWFVNAYGYTNTEIFSSKIHFIDEKRQQQLEEFLKEHKACKTLSYTDEVLSIKEVEPSGDYYYDIEVESGDHCFYAGNEGLILIHNCQDWDLRYFFYYGLMPDGIGTRTSVAGPPKHPEVAILHTAKILASAQTNFAGGEGFYNFLVFLAPYMRGLDYSRLKQLMQMMFFEYTQAYVARGGQLVFSNVQVQPGVPELWRDVPIVARGRVGPDVYGDYEDEVRLMFRALYDMAYQGDHLGKPFNFPKLENSISPEFFKPEYDEFWLNVHKVVARFGTPYFDNMMPAYRGYGKGVSCYQCCAYCFVETPESSPGFQDRLHFVDGKHFSMGSWQVVSLNLPRVAYRANGDDDKLFEETRRLMGLAVEVFKIKKKWMNLMLKHNRIPFATQHPIDPKTGKRGPPAIDFDELIFTIGIVGGNEMAQWHTGHQLHEHPDAIKILVKLILEMQRYRRVLEEESGLKLALARTPAESTAQRFAVADLLSDDYHYKAEKLIKGNLNRARSLLAEGEKDAPIYYSNGTNVYVGAEIGLIERIDIEQKFFPLLSGGNMLHVWLGEASPNPEALYKLTKRIATQTQVGYCAYTKDLTICNSCGRVSALINERCPYCGSSRVEWWSRVTGYYQAVSGWNEGKKKELQDRHRHVI